MAQALYRKWRSQTFDQVVGQEHVIQTLRNALRDNRVAHAYLFAGPRGTGKTSIARILAKALNCSAPEAERPCDKCPTCIAITEGRMLDLIEIDAASNNSVDDIRDLRDKVNFRPSEGRFKVYIIDEVHMLSMSAFNALLKTLEEPPPHARFMLATTEPHKIPATILSRCQRFDLRRIAIPEIVNHLHYIAGEEGFQAEAEALTAIARSSQGCMRDAISLLDQMLSYGNETVTFLQVQQALGAVSSQAVSGLIDALAERNVAAGLTLIQQLMTEGASLTEFCHQVIEHLRSVMVLQMTGEQSFLAELPADTIVQMQRQAQQLALATTLFAIKRFSTATVELKNSHQPQLPLELALIESIQGEVTAVANMGTVGIQAAVPVATVAPAASAPASPVAAAVSPSTAAGEADGANAAPAEAAEPAPLDEAAVKRLHSQWDNFKRMVRDKSGVRVQAALTAVRDIAVGDQTVAFAFGINQFSRDMIAEPEIMGQVVGLLSSVLGRSVKLDCQMGEKAKLTNMVQVRHEQQDGADPLVEYAVSTLGAEVVD
ncbi:MAG: DNA polymerase III subunit gamma/tau [Caldilineaceae bacterium]